MPYFNPLQPCGNYGFLALINSNDISLVFQQLLV